MDLVQQLTRLLDIRLLDPLDLLMEGDDAVQALRSLVRLRARGWAETLRHGDDREALMMAGRLIATLYPGDRPFDPPPEWWATPFGQAVAVRSGHPWAEAVSYATAGAMLGISRQGVHDLVRRGKLPRHPDGGVPSLAIRDRLRLRYGSSGQPSPDGPPPDGSHPHEPHPHEPSSHGPSSHEPHPHEPAHDGSLPGSPPGSVADDQPRRGEEQA
jgi:hypothetical protein